MFTAGELSRLLVRPLQIAGVLIVIALGVGLLVGHLITLASQSSSFSVTCDPITLPNSTATITMTYELNGMDAALAQFTQNSDTFDPLCDTPPKLG
jgi:hypothetical protein